MILMTWKTHVHHPRHYHVTNCVMIERVAKQWCNVKLCLYALPENCDLAINYIHFILVRRFRYYLQFPGGPKMSPTNFAKGG